MSVKRDVHQKHLRVSSFSFVVVGICPPKLFQKFDVSHDLDVALPDVMCVNDYYKTIIAIEAKSTVQNYAYVPADQIERCRDWVNMFGVYDSKYVVLAFKFGQTLQIIKNQSVSRKLKYHYKIFPHKRFTPSEIRADYDGNVMIKSTTNWMDANLEDYKF